MTSTTRVKLASAAIAFAGALWLDAAPAAAAEEGQKCVSTMTLADGSKVTVVVEGESCVFRTDTWSCTCTG